jgi:beta-lactamase class A
MSDLLEEKKKVRISRSLLLTLVSGAFALGVFIGAGTLGLFTPLQAEKGEGFAENREGEFKFIRASLESNKAVGPHSSKELKPFRYKVNALIQEKLKKDEATAISFYFRDLVNGNRFGIGENEKFSPKSLLKLPLMMAYFKWAETNPLVLRKTLTYTVTENQTEPKHIKPLTELVPGKHYTVNDLIFRMIAYDDAAAYSLLLVNLPQGRLDRIFKDLNVEYDPRKKDKEEDSLSLSAFAGLYRVLFNASYLNEEMSEKALRYLSKSEFRDGMASGIPQNIEIACKHGERTIFVTVNGEEEEVYQLHEFGIIYHPNRPYLVGIMARGDDFNSLMKVIRDITRLVYEEVDQQS